MSIQETYALWERMSKIGLAVVQGSVERVPVMERIERISKCKC